MFGESAGLVMDSREPPQFTVTAQQTRRGPAVGRVRRQSRRSGQGQAPASARGCDGDWRSPSLPPPPARRPTRLGRTPAGGAAPEVEPVYRDDTATRLATKVACARPAPLGPREADLTDHKVADRLDRL